MIVNDNLKTLFLFRYRKRLIREQIEVKDIEERLFSGNNMMKRIRRIYLGIKYFGK